LALPRGLLVLLSMAGVVVAVAGLRSASGIVGPAFLALMIVITIHPLLAWLQRHRVPGWLAVVLTMLVAYVSLVALAAALVFSVAQLATLLPATSRCSPASSTNSPAGSASVESPRSRSMPRSASST
jgi:AI-2 transport protein TqsA